MSPFSLLDNTTACWRVSADKNSEPAIIHSLYKPIRETEELVVSSGDFVVARVGKNRHVALVTDVYKEEGEVDINILMPRFPAKEFKWPREIKSATVPLPHVLCTVGLSECNDKFILTVEDTNKLVLLKIIKKSL